MSATTWFTSDQHFGHRGILMHRRFATLEDMAAELIARHNERVSPGDVVWHLGDFSLDEQAMEWALPRLNGRHRLVVGNHDRVHPCHRQAWKAHEVYRRAGFEVIAERTMFGDSYLGRVFLSHLPLAGTGDHGPEERYTAWRPTAGLLAETGCTVLLHGHVHGDYTHRLIGNLACINVGVDVRGFAPVSAADLRDIIAGVRAGQ